MKRLRTLPLGNLKSCWRVIASVQRRLVDIDRCWQSVLKDSSCLLDRWIIPQLSHRHESLVSSIYRVSSLIAYSHQQSQCCLNCQIHGHLKNTFWHLLLPPPTPLSPPPSPSLGNASSWHPGDQTCSSQYNSCRHKCVNLPLKADAPRNNRKISSRNEQHVSMSGATCDSARKHGRDCGSQ